MRSLVDIDRDLRNARREVFSADDATANAAEVRIVALRAELDTHPDEVERRDRVHADANARLLRRWE